MDFEDGECLKGSKEKRGKSWICSKGRRQTEYESDGVRDVLKRQPRDEERVGSRKKTGRWFQWWSQSASNLWTLPFNCQLIRRVDGGKGGMGGRQVAYGRDNAHHCHLKCCNLLCPHPKNCWNSISCGSSDDGHLFQESGNNKKPALWAIHFLFCLLDAGLTLRTISFNQNIHMIQFRNWFYTGSLWRRRCSFDWMWWLRNMKVWLSFFVTRRPLPRPLPPIHWCAFVCFCICVFVCFCVSV